MMSDSQNPSVPNAEAPCRPKHHELKCFTLQFEKILDGSQLAINRYLDPMRGFQPGDTLTLHEGFPDLEAKSGFQLTGRTISARISNIDRTGCIPEYGTLSLKDIGMLIIGESA
jgi:hypothetical protein